MTPPELRARLLPPDAPAPLAGADSTALMRHSCYALPLAVAVFKFAGRRRRTVRMSGMRRLRGGVSFAYPAAGRIAPRQAGSRAMAAGTALCRYMAAPPPQGHATRQLRRLRRNPAPERKTEQQRRLEIRAAVQRELAHRSDNTQASHRDSS